MTDESIGVANWYALKLKANRERMVEWALGICEIGAFLPLYSEKVRWSDRVKTAARPLFPGYIFAELATSDATAAVLDIPGVCHLLPSSLEPHPVPADQLALIHRLVESAFAIRPCPFAPGDRVTVRAGALQGTSGVVERLNGVSRLVVTIEMFSRAVSVELDREALESCR